MCCAGPFGGFSSNVSCNVCKPETCSKTMKTRVYIDSEREHIHSYFFFFQIINAIGHQRRRRLMKGGVIWKDFLCS